MHELSIAQSIAEIACRHAAGRRVSKVELKVGRLRQVVPASLAFSFELVAQGTVAEGAELEMQSVAARAVCRGCGTETELHAFPFQCAACTGFDLHIIAGEELEVESIECVEECDDAPRPSQNLRC
ncbi:MAG: hydrogenase maturation nickel metallochaperone HypA [Chloroflexota bacterium]